MSRLHIRRRALLGGAAAGCALMGLPQRLARARAPAAGELNFLFVFNTGGWDPTRVFATVFDNSDVDMEPDSEPGEVGGIAFVDHPERPAVRRFFEANASRALVVNGVQVRSIAHDICTMLALTGGTTGQTPDWATLIAQADASRPTLPHLVLGGPSFPGDLGALVARSGQNGQLEALLSGDVLDYSDLPVGGLTGPAESIVDAYLQRRSRARADAARSARAAGLAGTFDEALEKSLGLKDYRYVMDFTGGVGLGDQAAVAIDALSLGLSRCVSLGGGDNWDTHAGNDDGQSPLWEGLFSGLTELMERLDAAPGRAASRLSDETVVVVLSEMGRTPQLNATLGKDHWPFTSAMILGPGITGGRVVGAFDDSYYGALVDPGSAEISGDGKILSVESLGGALLALADIDPLEHISGVDPLLGILA